MVSKPMPIKRRQLKSSRTIFYRMRAQVQSALTAEKFLESLKRDAFN